MQEDKGLVLLIYKELSTSQYKNANQSKDVLFDTCMLKDLRMKCHSSYASEKLNTHINQIWQILKLLDIADDIYKCSCAIILLAFLCLKIFIIKKLEGNGLHF